MSALTTVSPAAQGGGTCAARAAPRAPEHALTSVLAVRWSSAHKLVKLRSTARAGRKGKGAGKKNNTYETSSALQGARRGGPENLNRPGQTQKLTREAASTKQMHRYTVYALTIG